MKPSAVSVTIWDLQGLPVAPSVVTEMEKAAEKLAKKENLAWDVAKA